MKERVAVIGSGIAGMAVAYQLRNECDVYLYEKNGYVGGHTNTVTLEREGGLIPIDTGFMVYNEKTYPNLIRLFSELDVESYETSMSFSVRDDLDRLEYACSGFDTFFAQRRNLLNPNHWGLYQDILKFFRAADSLIEENPRADYTISDFAEDYKLSPRVMNRFALPMAGAIWSTPPEGIRSFSALALLRFMKNHQMLGIGIQLKWRTVAGGSDQYKHRLLSRLTHSPVVNFSARGVHQDGEGAHFHDAQGNLSSFDYIVIATHADQALKLLAAPTPSQKRLLGSFEYNRNRAVLHSDPSVMPRERRAWASWNARRSAETKEEAHSSIHYWMNRLQNLNTTEDFFVSIDYPGKIDPSKTHWEANYEHPRFGAKAISAQSSLPELNTNSRIKFCGSYFRHGFHEDALWSGLQVAANILDEKGTLHELERI